MDTSLYPSKGTGTGTVSGTSRVLRNECRKTTVLYTHRVISRGKRSIFYRLQHWEAETSHAQLQPSRRCPPYEPEAHLDDWGVNGRGSTCPRTRAGSQDRTAGGGLRAARATAATLELAHRARTEIKRAAKFAPVPISLLMKELPPPFVTKSRSCTHVHRCIRPWGCRQGRSYRTLRSILAPWRAPSAIHFAPRDTVQNSTCGE